MHRVIQQLLEHIGVQLLFADTQALRSLVRARILPWEHLEAPIFPRVFAPLLGKVEELGVVSQESKLNGLTHAK